MVEWFEEWFNTPEYLNVYKHRNETDAKKLVELILSNVKLPHNAQVLDMACGAGRHSVLFASKGYQVTAVDLSQNLLEAARKAAEKQNLTMRFIKSDIRHLDLLTQFNLVVNLFTSFGYFEDDSENFSIFKIAYEHLLTDGYFVLDYFNKFYIEKNLIAYSEDSTKNGKLIQKRRVEGNRVIKNITILNNGSQKDYFESVRMYSKEELLTALRNTGFRINKVMGNFEGHDFDLESSGRIIIIAQR